ncbi:MAG: alpha/beta hydrolase [Raoultibacter sp.]
MHKEFTAQTSDGILLCGRVDAPVDPRAVVVIVHGLCEHYGRYNYLTKKFNEAGYTVYRFDHRGHGRSMGKAVYYADCTQIVADTDLFVECAAAQNPNLPVYLVGHSMGGFGAASYGTTFPGKAAGYVLSGAWTRDNRGLTVVDKTLADDAYLPNGLSGGTCSDPAVCAAYAADPLVAKEISVGLFRAIHAGQMWLKENAASFTDPVILLHGGDDGLVDPKDSLQFFEEIASTNKSMRIYAGLYHEIFNEYKKDRVIRDTIEWLDDQVK